MQNSLVQNKFISSSASSVKSGHSFSCMPTAATTSFLCPAVIRELHRWVRVSLKESSSEVRVHSVVIRGRRG